MKIPTTCGVLPTNLTMSDTRNCHRRNAHIERKNRTNANKTQTYKNKAYPKKGNPKSPSKGTNWVDWEETDYDNQYQEDISHINECPKEANRMFAMQEALRLFNRLRQEGESLENAAVEFDNSYWVIYSSLEYINAMEEMW